MKKTIVIIILAVYIASIAIVNFFGLEIKGFDGITYVSSIQCDTVTVHNETPKDLMPTNYIGPNRDIPLFVFDFIPAPGGTEYTSEAESVITNPNAVQINYEVKPHLADETGVRFEYDEAAMEGVAVFHEVSKTFVFLKPDTVFTITIKATDGSNKSTQVSIMGRSPAN